MPRIEEYDGYENPQYVGRKERDDESEEDRVLDEI